LAAAVFLALTAVGFVSGGATPLALGGRKVWKADLPEG
jgi:hypothetical protein